MGEVFFDPVHSFGYICIAYCYYGASTISSLAAPHVSLRGDCVGDVGCAVADPFFFVGKGLAGVNKWREVCNVMPSILYHEIC